MKSRFLAAVTGFIVLVSGLGAVQDPANPAVPSARRIVFLGDSITYGGEYVEFVEAWLRMQDPNWPGEVFDLGLPSETVSGLSEDGHAGGAFPRPDLHERLDRVLETIKPDLVLACYGMNDGIYLPLAEDRFKAFRDGMERLHAKVITAHAAMIHLTPAVYDAVAAGQTNGPARDYDAVLDRYSKWLLEQRSRGWVVVDLHGPVRRALDEQRARDRSFRLAGDGVHAGTLGHWLMARPILEFSGAPENVFKGASPAALTAMKPNGETILKMVQARQRVIKDSWLTAIGHKRPGMAAGLPIPEIEQRAARELVKIRAAAQPGATAP